MRLYVPFAATEVMERMEIKNLPLRSLCALWLQKALL